eukprot:1137676-Alexandrium_andersonii.AAC.1
MWSVVHESSCLLIFTGQPPVLQRSRRSNLVLWPIGVEAPTCSVHTYSGDSAGIRQSGAPLIRRPR